VTQESSGKYQAFLKVIHNYFLHRASCGEVCFNLSCLWVCVGGSVTTITRNCVHRSLPNWVCSMIDHLQLIKFWSPYYSQRAVFAYLSAFHYFGSCC